MLLIEQPSVLKVNIQQFDTDHEILVAITNRLHAAIKDGTAQQQLSPLLEELTRFTQMHFMAEEEVLQTHDYPDLTEHRQSHLQILGQLKRLCESRLNGSNPLPISVLQFLLNWLTDHTMAFDRKYGPYLNNRGVY